MSYLGRVGARAGGTAPSVGLAPAGRLASPFARIDQRLNLFVQWGTPLGRGTLLGGAPDQAGAEGAQVEAAPAAAASPTTRTAAIDMPPPERGAPPRHDVPPPAFAAPAVHVPPAPSDSSAYGHAPSARTSVASEQRSAESAVPAAKKTSHASEQPSPTPKPLGDRTARARKSERTSSEPRVSRHGEPSMPAAEPREGRRDIEAPVSIPENASDPSGAGALQQALDRVNAWMSKSSRDEPASPREKLGPAVQALPEARPELRAPAVFTPPANPAAIAPTRERRMSLPVRAEIEAATRLTIGSIEVRVIPPTPPPIVVQAPRERARVATAAPQSSARLPAHLTFGMRQR